MVRSYIENDPGIFFLFGSYLSFPMILFAFSVFFLDVESKSKDSKQIKAYQIAYTNTILFYISFKKRSSAVCGWWFYLDVSFPAACCGVWFIHC